MVFDDRPDSPTFGVFEDITLSRDSYSRLTVPPMVWMGFQGVEKGMSMLLNIASVPHDPEESDRKDLDEIIFNWEVLS